MTAIAIETTTVHIKERRSGAGLVLEHCEDRGCRVDEHGRSSCGREACPACGSSGGNLFADGAGEPIYCRCGHSWLPF